MYLARFSYDVAPLNRQRALDSIRHEVEAARKSGLNARILIPLTRAHGGPALQFEIELTSSGSARCVSPPGRRLKGRDR